MSQADLGRGTVIEDATIRNTSVSNFAMTPAVRSSTTTHALTKDSAPMQFIEPTVSQIITLPAEEECPGSVLYIVNMAATAGIDLTVNNDSGSTICDILSAVTASAKEMATLVCNGIAWRASVGTGT